MSIQVEANRPLSLYIHIPFCIHRCDYCAFYSTTYEKEEIVTLFYHVLIKEIETLVEQRGAPFESVYIGGGNPGLLGATRLLTIVQLVSSLGKVEEITIEMNPESLTQEMEILFSHGVTRLSIGIQTLSERHLKTLQRSASKSATLKALEMSKRIHHLYNTSINVDIMTCIPYQTLQESKEDISKCIELAHVDHISLYNLTYEEGTRLTTKRDENIIEAYNEEKEREFLINLWDHLETLGFHQYEISNFAVSEHHQCKHNIRYWNVEDYVGIGPSSVGTFHVGDTLYRKSGIPNLNHYVKEQEKYTIEEITTQEELVEYIMVKCRMKKGIDTHEFQERFNLSFDSFFSHELTLLKTHMKDTYILHSNTFSLTTSGLLLCDSMINLFMKRIME